MKASKGELEKLVDFEGERMPLWRALAERSKRASTQQEYWANDAWRDEQWKDLAFSRFLAMWGDLALGAYGLDCPSFSNTGRTLDQLRREAKIKAWAKSMLDQLELGGPDCDVATSDVWRVVALAALRNGVSWPASLDKRLPLDELDREDMLAIVAALPDERRNEALVATIDRMARDTAHQLAPILLARWPSRELAQWVIDHSEEQDESQKTILDRLKKLATKTRPAITAALAGAPDEPDGGVLPVGLKVTKQRKLTRPTPLQRKQLASAAKDYGGELESITYFALADTKGKHVYDAYRYNGDSGKVFKAGTTRVVASIIQHEADDCADALAAGLDRVLLRKRDV